MDHQLTAPQPNHRGEAAPKQVQERSKGLPKLAKRQAQSADLPYKPQKGLSGTDEPSRSATPATQNKQFSHRIYEIAYRKQQQVRKNMISDIPKHETTGFAKRRSSPHRILPVTKTPICNSYYKTASKMRRSQHIMNKHKNIKKHRYSDCIIKPLPKYEKCGFQWHH